MPFTTIISLPEFREIMDQPNLVILDARFDIDHEDMAVKNYLKGHIPGARQADLGLHMAGEIIPGVTGRRPLPTKEAFAQQIRSWGIDEDSQVVIYDDMNGIMAASRLWVMLRWAGLTNVALLSGGFQAWTSSGGDLTSRVNDIEISTYEPVYRDELVADLSMVEKASREGGLHLFDSRSLTDGIPSHDAIKGHIPQSKPADRALLSTSDGYWRSAAEIREHFEKVIDGADPNDVVFYCGSGVTAAQNVLGMAHAGFDGARMYFGSWSEWITDPDRPLDTSW
jgi:thiosulfate/3-mercaptopyruvate sulfurtransferase